MSKEIRALILLSKKRLNKRNRKRMEDIVCEYLSFETITQTKLNWKDMVKYFTISMEVKEWSNKKLRKKLKVLIQKNEY